MTNDARAFDFDAQQQCVAVAVGEGGNDAQAIARALALGPETIAGAAVERDVSWITAGTSPLIFSKSSCAFIRIIPL